jgi:hypothetical protein
MAIAGYGWPSWSVAGDKVDMRRIASIVMVQLDGALEESEMMTTAPS